MEVKSESEEEQDIWLATVRLRVAPCTTSKTRARALSVVKRRQVKKKGMKAKGAASRLMAKANEGSEEDRK